MLLLPERARLGGHDADRRPLLKTLDPRIALVIGAGVSGSGARSRVSNLSPQTGADDLFWPLIIRSFGTVLMFLPLSMATLGPIPKKDISAATGFYNLTRQLGGSIGVALLTTLLDAPPGVPPHGARREGLRRATRSRSSA